MEELDDSLKHMKEKWKKVLVVNLEKALIDVFSRHQIKSQKKIKRHGQRALMQDLWARICKY